MYALGQSPLQQAGSEDLQHDRKITRRNRKMRCNPVALLCKCNGQLVRSGDHHSKKMMGYFVSVRALAARMAVLLGKCEMIQAQSPQALNCVLVGSQGAFSSAAESSGLTPEPRREKAKPPSKEADWVPPAGFRSTSFLHVGSTCNSWRMMVRYREGTFPAIFSCR